MVPEKREIGKAGKGATRWKQRNNSDCSHGPGQEQAQRSNTAI